MNDLKTSMAEPIARASIAFEQRRTGNQRPKSVTVVMSEGTLVITLHGVLSPAEKSLAKTPAGPLSFGNFIGNSSVNRPNPSGKKSSKSQEWKCPMRPRKSSR